MPTIQAAKRTSHPEPPCYTKRDMPAFLSAMSPLALLVLLVFLFGVALIVALWSLLTLGSSPRAIATTRAPRAARVRVKKDEPRPLPTNRFMKQRLEADLKADDVVSELPTDHVSRSRVRILKSLEPDPELETPAFKPTTYDQLVNRQRAPKTGLPKMDAATDVPKTGLPSDSLRVESKPVKEVTTPKVPLENKIENTPNVAAPVVPPKKVTPPLRSNTEDTSTQPALFETGRHRRAVPQPETQPPLLEPSPRVRQPSVQREESEAAFRASQSSDAPPNPKPQQEKTQQEKEKAFENFLRKSDDLGF